MAEAVQAVLRLCRDCGNDRTRLMDIVRAVQERFGCVDDEAMETIARAVGTRRVEVESVVSFYAFLSTRPKGKVVIRLCNDIVDELKGSQAVAAAFEDELGIRFGQTTPDGKISLEYAACIGMSDQAPAALINDVVVTYLSGDAARSIVRKLREDPDPAALIGRLGDGNNAHDLVRAMVHNNLRKPGPVLFADRVPNEGLRKALAMTPAEVIRDIKTARLRGRGGAGFPTGMKWDFTRHAEGTPRYVLCNADEGEPGTFKDRVILTEKPDLLFEGMTLGGYAIGSELGILYLRAEYAYLRAFLEHVLQERRQEGLLGQSVMGKAGFHFDIRIQMGAGAYICGEETAMISSCEGLRGDPKTRPPFPAQKGYLGKPTTVNNVETYCCAARILEMGPGWFAAMGSKGSPGTKLLSVSGDCAKPGVFEVPFGIKLRDMLELCGGKDAYAVQVGGPSGQMVGRDALDRTLCYDDLATGGSLVVFNAQRDVLHIVARFLEFFIEESCGYCTPCRVGNVLLKERVDRIRAGQGEPDDLAYLQELGQTIKFASFCGLGQTSANPVLTTLKNFRPAYETRLVKPAEAPSASLRAGLRPAFDLRAALGPASAIAGRGSSHYPL